MSIGDSYRTATGKYEKLSCDNVTKLGKIIVSANRNRGIGCRESESGSLNQGPGIQGPRMPSPVMIRCSNMFERDQILYNFVPWLRLGVWIYRKLCVYLYNYVYACVRDPGPRPFPG